AGLFWAHDLVRQAVLHHAVLMDAGLVRKRVAADHGLVGRGEDAREVRQQLARAEDLPRVDVGTERNGLGSDAPRHHDLLERGVPGALAGAVHRALDLGRPRLDSRARVRHDDPGVVVAIAT